MSFDNFDRVLKAFSSSSIFVRHDNMKSASASLENGAVLQDISGVHAERIFSGFEEKVISMECMGTQQNLLQFMKEITGAREGIMTVFDYKDFVRISQELLGDMANYSTLLLNEEDGQQYFQLQDGKTGRSSIGVITAKGDRASMLMFVKLKVN